MGVLKGGLGGEDACAAQMRLSRRMVVDAPEGRCLQRLANSPAANTTPSFCVSIFYRNKLCFFLTPLEKQQTGW